MNSKVLWSGVVTIGVLGVVSAILGSMWISTGPIPVWIAQVMFVIGTITATTMGILLFWKWTFSVPRWVRMMIVIPIVIGILIWAAIATGFTKFNGTYGVTLDGSFDTCGVSCSVPAPSATVAPATLAAPAATAVPASTPLPTAAPIVPTVVVTATMPASGG